MSDARKIVGLDGEPIVVPDGVASPVDAEVVKILERALASAKRGEIVGVAVATALANGNTEFDYRTGSHATGVYCKFQLHHAITMMAHGYRDACRDACREMETSIEEEPSA